ncbi:toprim domain-containing protein [Thermoplasma sp.]|uniref:toprim domain-containing protein n=1 Tax=Thermoplasma sp. TaxID=1973142 RepID=UPI001279E346|nr:toprim domain-containing protein [Thermoplasma sp.]KAA8922272.1 MAG: hypothetical protein F6Q11_05165 [Thermoplasma sp.]
MEGRNDLKSLRRLRFNGEILILNRGTSLIEFSDTIARKYRRIILLTDLDTKGCDLERRMNQYLTGIGVDIDVYLWNFLRKNVPIKTIEELPSEYERQYEKGLQA